MNTINCALLTASLLGLSSAAAIAAPAVGLTGDKTLIFFDTANPAVSKSVVVSGVDRLLGIDYRPGTQTIVGVTLDHHIVTIDPATGAVKSTARMDKMLPMTGAPVIVDFNPAADRLRFMSGVTNHRVHPDTGAVTVDGALAYEQGDAQHGKTPAIAAAAYTNSFGKPEKTAMYNIDASNGALVQQTKPNDGVLKTVGMLGLKGKPITYAFDVSTDRDGKNTAFLVADKTLYTVNLETGAASPVGPVTGAVSDILDITVLPVN